jgi:hypothetical protein
MSKRRRQQKKKRGAMSRARTTKGGTSRVDRTTEILRSAPAEEAAELLLERAAGGPVDPDLIEAVRDTFGIGRAREITDAALRVRPGASALSLATDLALLTGDASAAEGHASRAVEEVDLPELRIRLALSKVQQGRIAEAIETLDPVLMVEPTRPAAVELQQDGLEMVALMDDLAVDECGCGSGRPYDECCQPVGARVLARFSDRRQLLDLRRAAYEWAAGDEAARAALQEALELWEGIIGESEGPIEWGQPPTDDDEVSPERRLLFEQAWMVPALQGFSVLDAFAASTQASPELARRARDWSTYAHWGLWLMRARAGSPGVALVDYLTGVEVYAALPDELQDLPRWTMLLGPVGVVDGVWRCASAIPFSLEEGCVIGMAAVFLMEDMAGQAGREGRPLARWLRTVHDEFNGLRMPDLAEPPPSEVVTRVLTIMRVLVPSLLETRRATSGEDSPERTELNPVLGPLAGENPEQEAVDLWFDEWTDRPNESMDGRSPLEAMDEDGEWAWVEATLRIIEHHADAHDIDLDTDSVRLELGLIDAEELEDEEDDDPPDHL